MLLSVENNLSRLPSSQVSFLSTNVTAGGTVWPVKNINAITNQWAQQVGQTGEERAEIVIVSGAPSGTAFNSSGTAKYAHPLDTPVYQIHYDKIIFLRSDTGTAGTATAIATVSITPDSFYTQYDDTSGVASYAYQTQYYNSVSGDTSGTSPWFIPGGPAFYSRQRLRDRVKANLYNANFIGDDDTIHDWIYEWTEEMTNTALKLNQAYSLGTAAYSFGTAGLGTITEPLFKYASKIEITYDGVTYLPSTEIPFNRFSATDYFSANAPRHAWQGDTIFHILPESTGGTVRMTLGNLSSEMTEDSDELSQFLRGYTRGCLEYCLYRAKNLDQKDADADKHYAKHLGIKADFVKEMTPRDQTGIKMIELIDSVGGRNEDMDITNGYYS